MSSSGQPDQVKLKPIFGVRPGVWLFGLYVLIFFLAVFLLFFLPGLRNPGSVLSVSTEPRGAAITVDGQYRGTSPCRFFVSRGARRVEAGIPGFVTAGAGIDVRGRIFGSFFFPRVQEISLSLQTPAPAAALLNAAAEFALWSFAGEPLAAWQIPQTLSEGVYRSTSGLLSGLPPEGAPSGASSPYAELEAILSGSAGYIQTRAALRDFLRARFLLDGGGVPPSPAGAVRTARKLLMEAARPGTAFWLADLLEGNAAADIAASSWYLEAAENSTGNAGEARRTGSGAGRAERTVEFAGMEFVYIDAGELVAGAGFPLTRNIGGFWISRTETTRTAWDAFVAANPEWAAAGREELARKGLVNDAYLEAYSPPPGAGVLGVHGVSWHAAKAWCAWAGALMAERISALQAAEGSGGAAFTVRLPSEHEWEYAARLSQQENGPALENMLGGLWEWCEDYYIPLDFLVPPGAKTVPSPERNLRGGSWINPAGSAGAGTRASLTPESCSPFTGFRPVIAGPPQ